MQSNSGILATSAISDGNQNRLQFDCPVNDCLVERIEIHSMIHLAQKT